MAQGAKPLPLSEAFEAACNCARVVWEVFETAEKVHVHTSHGTRPTETMVRRMVKAMKGLDAAIEEGIRWIEPLWLVFAKACGDSVWACGADAASVHVLTVRVAQKLRKLNWTRARIKKYYDAYVDKATGQLDWNRKVDSKLKVEVGDLINYGRFGGGPTIADLESELARVGDPGTVAGPTKSGPTALEEDILSLLQKPGTTRMTQRDIALALKRSAQSGHVKTTLSNLVKRGKLKNRRGFGYFLADVS